jgi:hypothetical protein
LCGKYLIFTSEASSQDYFIHTIGEDVKNISTKNVWPSSKDKMKYPEILFVSSRSIDKSAFTVLVKHHHAVLPAFLHITSSGKLYPYVENNKTHFPSKYSDMNFVHEPEFMAVCFPFVAGVVHSSKGNTKCIQFKNLFNPRSTSLKERDSFKSIRDPTPIRLTDKCTSIVAAANGFYFAVDSTIHYVALPPPQDQLELLIEDKFDHRAKKLKSILSSKYLQSFIYLLEFIKSFEWIF